ncbi:MAG: division/cell wall cluster transcriptional repressor MraZ [Desulfobacterales bacterium]|jgi:MraZ protein
MFRGRSSHTIDPKGRIIIPARFREIVRAKNSNGLMISTLDRCLVAYPYDEWSKIEERILAKAIRSATMRRFRRVFIGGAFNCNCDKQDRILIPAPLRQYAELDKHIVLVGVLDHFEIWSQEKWELENQQLEKDLQQEEVRNEIADLGL